MKCHSISLHVHVPFGNTCMYIQCVSPIQYAWQGWVWPSAFYWNSQTLRISFHQSYFWITIQTKHTKKFIWKSVLVTSLTWRTFIPGKSEKSHVSLISLGAWQTRLSGDSWTMKDHIINYHQVAIRSLFLYSDICLLIKSCCYNIKLIFITTLISELPQHCVILVQVVNMKSKIHNKTNDEKPPQPGFPGYPWSPGEPLRPGSPASPICPLGPIGPMAPLSPV